MGLRFPNWNRQYGAPRGYGADCEKISRTCGQNLSADEIPVNCPGSRRRPIDGVALARNRRRPVDLFTMTDLAEGFKMIFPIHPQSAMRVVRNLTDWVYTNERSE